MALPSINITTLFSLLGLSFLCYYVYKLATTIHLYTLHKSTLPRYLHPPSSDKPNWALVTGASDGIGLGCASELLSRGFDVILHGRNETKLASVKISLQKQYPTRKIRTAILDAATAARDPASIEKMVTSLNDGEKRITVLVNNVGGAAGVPRVWLPLHLREADEVDNLIDLNAVFATQLTRCILKYLFANAPALIINIGSVTGALSSPYLTPYAGAKAYLVNWSHGLGVELKCEKQDVEVLHINVGQVRAQHDRAEPTLWAPSGRTMARTICDAVGCGRADVTPYWPHALQIALMTSIPGSLLDVVMVRVALEKKEEEEKQKGKGKSE